MEANTTKEKWDMIEWNFEKSFSPFITFLFKTITENILKAPNYLGYMRFENT